MAFDYTGLRESTVVPLLAEFGDTGYLILPGTSIGAPYESQLDNNPVECPVTYVRTKFQKADNNGTLVEEGDVMFLISTEGIAHDPALALRIVVDCVEYNVVRIDPLKPGPVVMLWKLHARK